MVNFRGLVAGLMGLGLVLTGVRDLRAQAGAGGTGLPVEDAGRIDRAAAEVLKATGVPSASVAVVEGGRVAYVKAYGEARLGTGTEPAMAATTACSTRSDR